MSYRPNIRIFEDKIKKLQRKSFKDKGFDKELITLIKQDIESFLNCITSLDIEGFTAPIILKQINTYSELIYLYVVDSRVFSCAYSGGKDSTVTMDVVLKSLLLIKHMYGQEFINKTTYVIFSDTLLEMDPVIEGILNSINKIDEFGIKHKLCLDVRKVSPSTKNTYFSLLIGKGYIMPSRNSKRWCTDRLKIQPQKKLIVNILNQTKNGFIAITGQRQDESLERKNRMKAQTVEGSFKVHEFKDCNLYAPIEHWNTSDVWNHIDNHKLTWIDSLTLGRVYAEASGDGDECRSLLEGFETGSKSQCGMSARYGCWSCMIFEKDKTLGNLTKHYPYMKEMEKLRNWFAKYRDGHWDHNRDVYIHGKHKMKNYDFDNHRHGMKIPGGYTLYFRKRMLSELLKCERKVIEERKTPLITDAELAYIQECWIEDGDLDMSVVKIAHDRNFKHLINPLYPRVLVAVEEMRDFTKPKVGYVDVYNWKYVYDENDKFAFDSSKFCDRYFCQMAIQLEKKEKNSIALMKSLHSNKIKLSDKQMLINYIKILPLETSMDFVDSTKENYIREEWRKDKIGFITFLNKLENKEIKQPELNLFGYDGDYGSHFEQLDEFNKKGDIIHCESISLQDKMRWFEN
ncbi:MAG: hypothetical protein CL624_09450 [Arcobacter sp.]|nr:hypothetical protein [Arcobacter sp.]|tara:strand:- start:34486 stop:36372 length:1887 start_codon:yes stop_codon:yes gene_type:complete